MKAREVVLCWLSRARVPLGSFLLSITAGGGLLAADVKTVGIVCHCRADFPFGRRQPRAAAGHQSPP